MTPPMAPEERRVADRRAQPKKSPALLIAIGAAFVLLAAWGGVQQWQIGRLSSAQQDKRLELQIKGVNEHLALVDEELTGIVDRQKQVLQRSDFESAHAALTRQFETLKKQVESLRSDDSTARDLLALTAQIETLQTGMDALGKRVAALSVRKPPAQTQPVSRPTQKKPAPKPVVLTPPFDVVGIEVRGGERFLSIAPVGSTRLDQISLIRPGDIRQSWRLERIGTKTAEFDVRGTEQVVFLR
ncbi:MULTISPECIES: hypothetical protein [Pseudomonadaceae]|uniref:hypothetical protein n=1 Tax=Pseudomonadaceae TaxID=135621 RepID=UPI000F78A484|nr:MULTISPECIES: hypothetical protein [Pseudomonadaceae]MBD3877988.1 hypothetical protein [Stutzerimonas kunmingensis]MDH0214541.1 hypothetical protein [Stutzerimonas stutzeri]MDH0261876.1 hypothetical protein [Stutzerimonas stutzeri]MDI9730245.1 hypothetical protein [Stutzerimonas stutzeri]MDI9750266.1 hypothetical protein [Stutzerimonas stutzeri]